MRKEIKLPLVWIKNLDTLYITSARLDMTNEELTAKPYSGGVFKVVPGVKGVKSYFFGFYRFVISCLIHVAQHEHIFGCCILNRSLTMSNSGNENK